MAHHLFSRLLSVIILTAHLHIFASVIENSTCINFDQTHKYRLTWSDYQAVDKITTN